MKIAGIANGGHDGAYAIFENGIPLIHEEDERFSRIKENPGDPFKLLLDHYDKCDELDYITTFISEWKGGPSQLWPKSYRKIKDLPAKYIQLGHHLCHASNAFYSSNFDNALIITMDGGGQDNDGNGNYVTTFTIYEGIENKISKITSLPSSFNMGSFWSNCTSKIFGLSSGLPGGNQAGTVMGMAALGKPKYIDKFHHSNTDYNSLQKLANQDEQTMFDLAASLQQYTENTIKDIIDPFIQQYNPKNICLSGGVSLNCVMAGKFIEWYPNINFYADPVPYDAGLALGGPRYVWHHILNNPRIIWEDNSTPYLGKTYSKEEIISELNKRQIEYDVVSDDDVITLLSNDTNVISVYGGRSESGRRALGNRSILADPRNPKMKDIINEKVKHRQWFRPFAPSILREEVSNWFKKDASSPYMSFVLEFKDEVRDKVPAVVHFNGTARLQTVTEKDNKWYYNFIKKFKEKTGVPILLNTSFNDREPIVETPEHAINCFLGTRIDYLYFSDYNILVKGKK
tara:strand:- start:19569 stop:21113 length:1545 start_codon:yes stop_codon:yes gene_type:complete